MVPVSNDADADADADSDADYALVDDSMEPLDSADIAIADKTVCGGAKELGHLLPLYPDRIHSPAILGHTSEAWPGRFGIPYQCHEISHSIRWHTSCCIGVLSQGSSLRQRPLVLS